VPGAVVFDIKKQFKFVMRLRGESTENRQGSLGQVQIRLVPAFNDVEPQPTHFRNSPTQPQADEASTHCKRKT
jgi:hypothetical protein